MILFSSQIRDRETDPGICLTLPTLGGDASLVIFLFLSFFFPPKPKYDEPLWTSKCTLHSYATQTGFSADLLIRATEDLGTVINLLIPLKQGRFLYFEIRILQVEQWVMFSKTFKIF